MPSPARTGVFCRVKPSPAELPAQDLRLLHPELLLRENPLLFQRSELFELLDGVVGDSAGGRWWRLVAGCS